jgi:sulfur relay (sulfurtransferase) complex TusBCD TusD component (DsrE family)
MNNKSRSTFCILVTSGPAHENSNTLRGIAGEAIKSGLDVHIFLMCDGVHHIYQDDFISLMKRGAVVTLCSHNASQRNVEKQPGVNFGSQYDLAFMVANADCFLALT